MSSQPTSHATAARKTSAEELKKKTYVARKQRIADANQKDDQKRNAVLERKRRLDEEERAKKEVCVYNNACNIKHVMIKDEHVTAYFGCRTLIHLC